MNKHPQIRKIAVALRLSFSSHRDILYGISKYAKSHHWSLQIIPIPETFNEEMFSQLESNGTEGIITSDYGSAETARCLVMSGMPLVFLGARSRSLSKRTSNIAYVRVDDTAIGATGARFLCSRGQFRSVGFVPSNTKNHCSLLRLRGFMQELSGRGVSVRVFKGPCVVDGSEGDVNALSEWLAALPKPAAVMALYDIRAIQLLEAAKRAGVSIPDQLLVIGADNDELLCDLAEPTLTSIASDYVQLGTLAAEAMSKMLSSRTLLQAFGLRMKSAAVVERETTLHLPPATRMINEALSFIDKHYTSPISAKDVVEHLGVSRRLAEFRFSVATGKSILQYIIEKRLQAVREKLLSSDMPITTISASCGFRSENYAKNIFHRRFGMSMREFRKLRKHGKRT
ncbi:MAG: substrate-binding domain-containing protein [Kiritimatiellae bacterium]|nr:substrate-binding domain-containing protein [Kiritimatiellia bacterium]